MKYSFLAVLTLSLFNCSKEDEVAQENATVNTEASSLRFDTVGTGDHHTFFRIQSRFGERNYITNLGSSADYYRLRAVRSLSNTTNEALWHIRETDEENVVYIQSVNSGKLLCATHNTNGRLAIYQSTTVCNVDEYKWELVPTVFSNGRVSYAFKNKAYNKFLKMHSRNDRLQLANSGRGVKFNFFLHKVDYDNGFWRVREPYINFVCN